MLLKKYTEFCDRKNDISIKRFEPMDGPPDTIISVNYFYYF